MCEDTLTLIVIGTFIFGMAAAYGITHGWKTLINDLTGRRE